VPALQSVQPPVTVLLSVTANLPAGQFVQLDAPVLMAEEPAGQLTQTSGLVAPVEVEYVPAMHP